MQHGERDGPWRAHASQPGHRRVIESCLYGERPFALAQVATPVAFVEEHRERHVTRRQLLHHVPIPTRALQCLDTALKLPDDAIRLPRLLARRPSPIS